MKTQIALMTSLFLTALCTVASASEPTHKFVGTGTAYTPDGQIVSNYQVEVLNTELANHVIQSQATITTADGQKKIVNQTITPNENGRSWKVESNLGQGGGACYGDICENYIQGADGSAFATTIVNDGPNSRRDITVQMKDGKAVQMMRQSLTRVQ